ncbi:MAG: RidA family protein [Sphingomonadales bacterium]|nr:MAG: RidA family protein [Sphingomonadales bacterium]TNF06072.1 MAG: RidA family protein [Sphingomonadales bacterium]
MTSIEADAGKTEPAVAPHLSLAVDAAGLLFVSGQLAFVEGKLLQGGIAEQTRQALANIEAVLAQRGLARRDIVKTTVWITKRDDFQGFNAAYAEFFGDVRPARSTVVAELAIPDALVEIEAIAATQGSAG